MDGGRARDILVEMESCLRVVGVYDAIVTIVTQLCCHPACFLSRAFQQKLNKVLECPAFVLLIV